MTQIAISAAPRALEWIETTRMARPLHIFDQVINLVNQDVQVLSITTPAIGNGPFSLLVGEGGFQQVASAQSAISIELDILLVGSLSIDLSQLQPWNPRPAWGPLAQNQIHALSQNIHALLSPASQDQNFPGVFGSVGETAQSGSPFSRAASRALEQMREGFQLADRQAILQGATELSGLGVGLTPAGDDFLVGMMHGLWARAAELAEPLCRAIAQTASPRTSTLSAAWLGTASQGEAAQVWHTLLQAIQTGDADSVGPALQHILRTGETSGADALTGFFFILNQEQVL